MTRRGKPRMGRSLPCTPEDLEIFKRINHSMRCPTCGTPRGNVGYRYALADLRDGHLMLRRALELSVLLG